MTHSVKLDVFEGPLDLLLHLITRQRVDIYEVSLATIARQYVDVLNAADDLDLEAATGFLVVAATLLELKASRLLPAASAEEDELRLLEERDLLLARLVECATFRAAGEWIAGELEGAAALHARFVPLDPALARLEPDPLAHTDLADLAAAAAIALASPPAPEIDLEHIAPRTASVRDAIVSIARRLEEGAEVRFGDMPPRGATRLELVVHFLALLELYKAGAVALRQVERFGDIRARWTGAVPAAQVAAEADEYVLERGGA
jgi:segregation and condensation protein A